MSIIWPFVCHCDREAPCYCLQLVLVDGDGGITDVEIVGSVACTECACAWPEGSSGSARGHQQSACGTPQGWEILARVAARRPLARVMSVATTAKLSAVTLSATAKLVCIMLSAAVATKDNCQENTKLV